jgi:predicted secreted Zn-dependent protease
MNSLKIKLMPSHKMNRIPQLLLVVLCCLFFVAPGKAEYSETLTYLRYPVEHTLGNSLLQNLNKASPIRHEGHIFHGYTTWNVSWNYRWYEEANGRCAITSNTTTLHAEITLPELHPTAPPEQQIEFKTYVTALEFHELGHVQYGRAAAQEIDRRIKDFPAQSSCRLLEQGIQKMAEQALEAARQKERDYDHKTQHGRTQGAWLER